MNVVSTTLLKAVEDLGSVSDSSTPDVFIAEDEFVVVAKSPFYYGVTIALEDGSNLDSVGGAMEAIVEKLKSLVDSEADCELELVIELDPSTVPDPVLFERARRLTMLFFEVLLKAVTVSQRDSRVNSRLANLVTHPSLSLHRGRNSLT